MTTCLGFIAFAIFAVFLIIDILRGRSANANRKAHKARHISSRLRVSK